MNYFHSFTWLRLIWHIFACVSLLPAHVYAAWPIDWPSPLPKKLVIPPPSEPRIVYRIDLRPPTVIFERGFQSWAMSNDVIANNDALAHVSGESLRDRTSNWITTTSSADAAMMYFEQTLASHLRPTGITYGWLYEMESANLEGYSATWAALEYRNRLYDYLRPLQQPLQATDEALRERFEMVLDYDESTSHLSEWLFRGEIPSRNIIRAIRIGFNPENGRYFRFNSVVNGHNPIVSNANFVSSPAHIRQHPVNPMDAPALPGFTWQVLGEDYMEQPPEASASARGSISTSSSLGMTCLGAGAARSASSRSVSIDDSQTTCPTFDKVKKAKITAYRPSVLAFNARYGNYQGVYCLNPTPMTGYIGLNFVPCSDSTAKFEYDAVDRLSTMWHGNEWCITAPPSVIDNLTPWDYLKMEPCTLDSQYQRWVIKNGRVSSLIGGYTLQEYANSTIISKNNDGLDVTLNPAKMAADFFILPSPVRSKNIELAMGWRWNGKIYFSTVGSTSPWSYHYYYRSYYDSTNKTIKFIDLTSTSKYSTVPPNFNCLVSKQYTSRVNTWDWTKWRVCNSSDPATLADSKWTIKSVESADNKELKVSFADLFNEPLWVLSASSNVVNNGSFYTDYNYLVDHSVDSVTKFVIPREKELLIRRFAK